MRARKTSPRASAAKNSACWSRAWRAGEAAGYFERLRQHIESLRVQVGNQELRMTVSIGFCTARRQRRIPHHLLGEADKHLYLAKAGGRNRLSYAALAGAAAA